QTAIQGKVMDKRQQPIVGANIYLDGTYDGTTSDMEGQFELITYEKGQQVLVISSIGFQKYNYAFSTDSAVAFLEIILEEKINELESVVITAGTFEDGEKKQSMVLSAFDVASTASAQGDIYGAFNNVPGTQKVGEEGKLFVRGGESYETRTFMDGMYVADPFYSQVNNIPTRGRFSPLLFDGLLFSTGGYSAEYGQALSSVVALKTLGLENEDKSSLSLMSVGTGFSQVKAWEKSSVAFTADYINSALHNQMFGSDINWQSDPNLLNTSFMLRHKTGQSGLIKAFASVQLNRMEMLYDNFPSDQSQNLSLNDESWYANTTYTDMINEKWMIQSGWAYSYSKDKMLLDTIHMQTVNQDHHLRFKATHLTSESFKWKTGGEWFISQYGQDVKAGAAGAFLDYRNHQLAAFAEADWQISPVVAIRFGGRTEYSSLLKKAEVSPRLSGAVKTGKNSQISMAYGTFFQNPQEDYLKINPHLQTEQSSHLIVNYQYKNEKRLLRIEAYQKEYDRLVIFNNEFSFNPEDYTNMGYGSSNGIDLFWRDGNTFKNVDYWVSYSFNDSKRLYRDYPGEVTPPYASRHNLSMVWKQFVPAWSSFFCLTYGVASKRPYHNPNLEGFMQIKTNVYQDVSFNITYLTRVMNREAVLHLMLNNITGRKNIYGYEYRQSPDENGYYDGKAIVAPTKQQAVLVLMIML
ncbi:TonB-dependent receptor, partial [Carboxylicivirga caseinilyticus]|uniref:TonB-dependent receptor n=1 Tax=Carboxylicivirga caseinilyticus TaxID=3417572 RepID=UPI003D33FD0F|nr:TonB-dependent receptor [Marinilabiliaceae bacterium A049]